jgi:beta-lactamase class A
MKIATPLFVLSLIVAACSTNRSIDDLRNDIVSKLDSLNAKYAVAFRDVQTGEELIINGHDMFHAASTMKTPVMIELYKQASEGRFSLDDSILVHTEFNSIVDSTFSLSPGDDSDSSLYLLVGKKHPISALLYLMIIKSSNLATNILIELVDAKKVTQTMRDMGANDILVLRGVEDGKAFRAGLNNQTSAYDLMLIFDQLARRSVVTAQSSEDMIDILLDQAFNDMIPALLPKDVKVAHKTGWITGLHHDSGIVILPDGRQYVLVLLTSNLKDEETAVRAMAEVSGMIYDYFQ